jgi:hypothetical protein
MDIDKNLIPKKECSFFTQKLIDIHFYHKGCTPITNFDEYNEDVFLKSFAFWKIFLIFLFLLAIGAINLVTSTKETIEYISNKPQNLFIEFLLFFGAFVISTLLMYFMRLGKKVIMKQLYVSSFIIFIFCILKHLSFEFSGLYRWRFGSDACNENNKKKECNKCDNGFFTGLFWDGLGKYGLGFTVFLLIFFGMSLNNPKYTEKVFNYEFSRVNSGIYLACILIVFIIGCFLEKIETTGIKECKNKDKNVFSKIKDGCALVSLTFMIIITILLPYILFLWIKGKSLGIDSTNLIKNKINTGKYYNCYYKNEPFRFILILIESLLIYLIFSLAEIGIECLRTGKKFLDLMKDTHFWIKTWPSLVGILVIQIVLEYTNWYETHLFNKEQISAKTCNKKVEPTL